MQDKTKNKKEKNEIKVRDLKPAKDPKGGIPPGPAARAGPVRGQVPARSRLICGAKIERRSN